jgi:hypothetical protein
MITSRRYIYDGHGHSTASDGLHTPERILDEAVRKGVTIVGLSDHNVTTNLPRFLEYADKLNRDEVKVLPIPSIEIRSTDGDMLVAIANRDKAENFIIEYKKPRKPLHSVEVIEHFIDRYNAIVIILHPELSYVKGLSVERIDELLTIIPPRYHKNMGIEVHNWMTQAFFWNRAKTEKKLRKENGRFNLAVFSFTDYHDARHVGNGSTEIQMTDLSSDAFITAIQNRQTAPYTKSNQSLQEFLEIARASLSAEAISRLSKRDFHV